MTTKIKGVLGTPGPNEKQLNLTYLNNNINFNRKVLFSEFGDDINEYGTINIVRHYKDYIIDTKGNVYRRKDFRPLKYLKNKDGYIRVTLGRSILRQMHRLVLMSFRPIENPEKYQVNHIDGNPSNNNLDNLEWVTNGQNKQHAHAARRGQQMNSVGVVVRNVDTGEVKTYIHIFDAAVDLKLHKDVILNRLKKPINHVWHDGLQFKRLSDPTEWKPITDELLRTRSKHSFLPVKMLTMWDNKEYTFNTVNDAAKFLDANISVVWSKLYEDGPRASQTDGSNNPDRFFQIKLLRDNRPWKTYPTTWHAIADASPIQVYPVIVIFPDGTEKIFNSAAECAKYFNVGKTTIFYKLSLKRTTPQRDGNIYYPYLDWYALKNK